MSSRKRSHAVAALSAGDEGANRQPAQPSPSAADAAAASPSSHAAAAAASSDAAADDVFKSATLLEAAGQASAVYGVSAAAALEEFRRFIELKVFVADSEATKLSPTPLMDHLWHAAILDTRLYARLQQQIGMTLHHSPAGASLEAAATAAREKRLETMRTLYRVKHDADPLSFKIDGDQIRSSSAAVSQAAAEESKSNAVSAARSSAEAKAKSNGSKSLTPAENGAAITVILQTLSGSSEMVQVPADAPIKNTLLSFCEKHGYPVDLGVGGDLRFIHLGRYLNGQEIPANFGMRDGAIIHSVLKLRAC